MRRRSRRSRPSHRSSSEGKASLVAYLIAVPISLLVPAVAVALYVAVSVTWLIPDRRIERILAG